MEQLKKVAAPNPSATVEKYVGTPGVCEPAALLGSAGELVVPKRGNGQRIVALAEKGDRARGMLDTVLDGEIGGPFASLCVLA
ncbi:MAG: cobalamin biosynthesis protein [Pirellulales bacterium]